MKKVKVCVSYNVIVEVDFDDTRKDYDEYLDAKIEEAKDLADRVMESGPHKSKVTNAEVWGMIE